MLGALSITEGDRVCEGARGMYDRDGVSGLSGSEGKLGFNTGISPREGPLVREQDPSGGLDLLSEPSIEGSSPIGSTILTLTALRLDCGTNLECAEEDDDTYGRSDISIDVSKRIEEPLPCMFPVGVPSFELAKDVSKYGGGPE